MMGKVKQPGWEKLRPRLETVEDVELLAPLFNGRKRGSGKHAARRLLAKTGGLQGLWNASESELEGWGVAGSTVAAVLALRELMRRALDPGEKRELLESPAHVASYLAFRYGRRDQEVMGALFLDVRHHLIAESEIYRGTLYRAAVEPRAVLKEALLVKAAGFILFHNHPSGDPAPSAEDIKFTKRMAEAGEVVGVKLVDHMIVGGRRWVSLQRRGVW